jgi:cell division protein FtsB
MQGILYTINKLGETLAEAEARLAQITQENEVLRARVTELEGGAPAPARDRASETAN